MRLSLIMLLIAAAGCNCSKPPTKPTPKQEGEPCGSDDSCATGMCDGTPGFQPLCVRPCASICHADEVCVEFTPPRFACQPDQRKLCQPCELDSDCPYPSDKCLVVNGEHVCGRDCAFDQTCPTGYRCVNGMGTDGQPKPQQCTPVNASCACLARGDFNQPCQVSNQYGTCNGVKQCDLVLNTVICSAVDPKPEVCNGKDDNCNGTIDEGLGPVTCGVGECQRTVNACLDGGSSPCVPGTPVQEICNGKDDDCDGVIDNGFAAAPHMSACGNVCDVGWVDLNHDPVDGCEYQCTFTSAIDLPDLNFLDANCDGIDGEVTNGVFVAPAPTGNDSNAGTMAAPKATLAAAVSWAVTTNKRDVYLAQGVYDGPVALTGATNLNVAGAYNAATWQRSFTNSVAVDGGNPALLIDGSNNVLVQALSLAGADGTAALPTGYGIFVRESQGVKLESLDVRAGTGAPGVDGLAGDAGVPGGAGGVGPAGCIDDQIGFDIAALWCFVNSSCTSRPAAGGLGTSACGYPGGIGGQPTRGPGSGSGTAGQGAQFGSGLGGAGAPGGLAQGPAGAAYNGGVGQAGTDGANGAGAAAPGTFGSTGFVLASGTAGVSATHGKGGGGGGGGGGALGSDGFTQICDAWGSSGGGGGGGGCAGLAGLGGTGGGASLGLFLYNSTVSGQSVVVRAGSGGKGGNGGAGGLGGGGGAAGVPGYAGEQGNASVGGNGGPGGNGGRGGHGGAGAGGSSYALAKNATSTWTAISGTQLTYGTAGVAGTSPGNGSVAGTAGVIISY